MWPAMRHDGAIERVGHETVTRLAEAGIPGYAVLSVGKVLKPSLRDQATHTARHLASAARQPRCLPPAVTQLVAAQLHEVVNSRQRWQLAATRNSGEAAV